MTVAADIPSFIQIPGNGSALSFAFPFKIFQSTDLVVGFIVSGTYTEQMTGFSVTNVDVNGGGNVVFTTAPPVGTTVDIRSDTPQIQNTEFANLGQFLPEDHTEAFDRLTRMVQDVYRQTYTFGIHGPDQEDTPWTQLPQASVRAGLGLLFDSNGLPTVGNFAPSAYAFYESFTAGSGQTAFTLAVAPAVATVNLVSLDGAVLVPGIDYTINGSVVTLTSGALAGQVLYASGSIAFSGLNPTTSPESIAGLNPTNYQYIATPVYDMQRYGIQPDGVDNTAIVQAVYNMAKVSGGTLMFPPNGDYAFYLDISGDGHAQVFINGQGSTFRPYTATPTNSCVVYANNSASSYSDTYVRFENCNIDSALYSAQSTPVVNYGVYHNYAASRFYNCHLTYAKVGNFYGMFSQYSEFWDCRFDIANFSTSSAGCILDSNSLAASTNEVNFYRCEFFSNSIGLWLKGAQKTRLRDCTIQGNGGGLGAILIDSDSTGSQSGGTDIDGCWFELNSNDCIHESVGFNTNVVKCMFWATGGVPTVTFTHCSGINWDGNQAPGGITVTINHPSGNTDCASLKWRGNQVSTSGSMIPILNITHPGTYDLDLHWSSFFTGTLTGCSGAAPTAVFNYTVDGSCVDLKLTAILGTSNSTSCTLTGLPSSISPLNSVYGMVAFLEDNSAQFSGQCSILTSANTTLNFYKGNSASAFTASGSKGIAAGNVFRYPLYT